MRSERLVPASDILPRISAIVINPYDTPNDLADTNETLLAFVAFVQVERRRHKRTTELGGRRRLDPFVSMTVLVIVDRNSPGRFKQRPAPCAFRPQQL